MTFRRWLVAGLLLLMAAGGLSQLSRERCFSLILPSICRAETAEKVVAPLDAADRQGREALPLVAA